MAGIQRRAMYTRTSGDLLVNDLGPSGQPWVSWIGLDSGGGAYPIGPNGPHSSRLLAVVIRATSLITGPLTAAPFRVVDTVTGRPSVVPRWVTDPMLLRPDDRFGSSSAPAVTRLPRSQFWTGWLRSAIWFGLGAFLAAEDAAGAPLAGSAMLLHPHTLDTARVDGARVWVVCDPESPGDRVVFDRDGRLQLGGFRYRLVVLRNPHSPVDPDGRSQGVFELAPDAFGLARQVQSYASGTFRSGIPAGYLKTTQPNATAEQAAELKRKWLENHGGDRRSIAVLNATTEFVPLNLSPVDAALADVKRIALADVAMAFGLDPMTLGAAGQSGTYTNLRDAWANHRDFGLAPWVAAVEDTLSALLPATTGARVDFDRFANPPAGERYAAYKAALDAQILTVGEVRAMEGLAGLDEPGPAPEEGP